jgi:hypothetical protein
MIWKTFPHNITSFIHHILYSLDLSEMLIVVSHDSTPFVSSLDNPDHLHHLVLLLLLLHMIFYLLIFLILVNMSHHPPIHLLLLLHFFLHSLIILLLLHMCHHPPILLLHMYHKLLMLWTLCSHFVLHNLIMVERHMRVYFHQWFLT